jgi:thymidylate synthase (FAD)
VNIVKPYARLMGPIGGPIAEFTREDGVSLLRRIEYLGRFSHASEDAQTEDSWQRFIPAVVMQHGDWSIVEHASVTVDCVVDRGISHEWVRHRLFSFTQSSTRFINYAKKMPPTFIQPAGLTREQEMCWNSAIQECEGMYRQLLGLGQTPQIARSVFPNALATRLAVTGNLRNWRHLFIMRTTKETHPQFREVTLPLLEEFKAKIPLLFDDIEPMAKQAEGMKKAR